LPIDCHLMSGLVNEAIGLNLPLCGTALAMVAVDTWVPAYCAVAVPSAF
jgi:hypothetical protein